MKGIIESIQLRIEALLDSEYLFNHDQKHLRSNMLVLVYLFMMAEVVNVITVLTGGWTGGDLLVVLIPVLLGLLVGWAIREMESSNSGLFLTAVYLLVCVWTHLFFSSLSVFGILWILIYPVAICFFLGNHFGIPFLIVLCANVVIAVSSIFDIWRGKLFLLHKFDSSVNAQFVTAFITACVLGIVIEYIHARINLHLAALANKITESSYRDALTGLLTRRAFYDRYSREVEESGKTNKSTFLIMGDVDHFKAVNDTYGHAIGDEILKHVSKVLMEHAVGENLSFRWGGEEFILFMREKTLEDAVATANQIRVVLDHSPYVDAGLGSIRATMSFGVHKYDKSLTMDKNISIVDAYLYDAKRKGRNRVESELQN